MDEVKKYLACDGRVSVIIANTTNMIEEYRKLWSFASPSISANT